MCWDFCEVAPLGDNTGSFSNSLIWTADTIEPLGIGEPAVVSQADATSRPYQGVVVSTDPPYYDNIGYSDLSDYFYVWLRKSLRSVQRNLFNTMLVPKADELVANPYRHGGKKGAQEFFEAGFKDVFEIARETASGSYPIAVYYAFKQSEDEAEGQASTGWETILASMVTSGWTVTGTWPMRTEAGNRMIGNGTNALASSIVLALRPRPETAAVIDRRGLVSELRSALPKALRDLQQGGIAPVDLAQAAIGPGMAVFSNYAKVIEPNGEPMSVRDALRQINAILDEVLSEQEGDFDGDTRWCVAWFEQHGFEASAYGEAETLANAKNASITGLAHSGVLSSGAGKVKLFSTDDLPVAYDPMTDYRISLWEVVLHMAKALGSHGLDAAGRILARAEQRGVDMTAAHELAYRLFAVSEKLGLTQTAILFNTLGSSWSEVRTAAEASLSSAPVTVGGELDFDSLLEE